MNEHIKNDPPETPQTDSEVLAVVKKIQQQLVFLEKKLDTLLAKSSEASFHRPRHFQKSFRPFDRPSRPGEGNRGSHPGERSFSQGRPFGKPHGGPNFHGQSSKRSGEGGPNFHGQSSKRSGEGSGHRKFDRGKKGFFRQAKQSS
ncbi:MAG: hypothetical protein A3A73_03380 [Omnitrophica bacterium RIFCSPLOWO2_01_FULL_50_24]|nr:MAG: hypothetical protein A3A73_03380 [Omnitrophica bacterium RIFCSPLOWO2_01_FULL_50_24]